jgi:hypothetical protein
MKRIITATAMSLMLTTSICAAQQVKDLQTYKYTDAATTNDILASDLIGMRIYSVEKDYDRFNENYQARTDEEKDWDDIGEVDDVILGFDGSVKAVVLGVGGFLGIGEKDIALPMDQLKVVREQDDADSFFLVVNANKDVLTSAEAYENPNRSNEPSEATKMADSNAEGSAASRPMLPRADVQRDGYKEAKVSELTAEDLQDANVYDANDEDIGEVDQLIISEDGQIKKVVLDIGGFLGIGEKPVAMTFDELQIIREDGGDDLRIYVGATKEQLEKQPTYKADQ